MNTREAYQALLNGKKVKDRDGDLWSMDEDGDLCLNENLTTHLLDSALTPFEIYEELATDEQLIAEMEATAKSASYEYERLAYERCAEMLKTRKVKQ
jgi:hypothetical protein